MTSIHTFLSISTEEENDEYVEVINELVIINKLTTLKFTDYFGSHAFLSHVWTRELSDKGAYNFLVILTHSFTFNLDTNKQLSHLPPFRVTDDDVIEFQTQKRVNGSTFVPTGKYCSWNKLSELNPGVVKPQPRPEQFKVRSDDHTSTTSQFNKSSSPRKDNKESDIHVSPTKSSGASRWATSTKTQTVGQMPKDIPNGAARETPKQPSLISRLNNDQLGNTPEKSTTRRRSNGQSNIQKAAPPHLTQSTATMDNHNRVPELQKRAQLPHPQIPSQLNPDASQFNFGSVQNRRSSLGSRRNRQNEQQGDKNSDILKIKKESIPKTTPDTNTSLWAPKPASTSLHAPNPSVEAAETKVSTSRPPKLPPTGPRKSNTDRKSSLNKTGKPKHNDIGMGNAHGSANTSTTNGPDNGQVNAHANSKTNGHSRGHTRQSSVNELLLRLRAATLATDQDGASGSVTEQSQSQLEPIKVVPPRKPSQSRQPSTVPPNKTSQLSPPSKPSQLSEPRKQAHIPSSKPFFPPQKPRRQSYQKEAAVPSTTASMHAPRDQLNTRKPSYDGKPTPFRFAEPPKAPRSMRKGNVLQPQAKPFTPAQRPIQTAESSRPVKHQHKDPNLRHKTSLTSNISWADADDGMDLPDISALNR